jgi:hypothetical protein
MWDEDGPEERSRGWDLYVMVFGTLYAASILLNFVLMVAAVFR